jgi:hypothetical protein
MVMFVTIVLETSNDGNTFISCPQIIKKIILIMVIKNHFIAFFRNIKKNLLP